MNACIGPLEIEVLVPGVPEKLGKWSFQQGTVIGEEEGLFNPGDVAKALHEARADKRSVAVMLIARDGNDHFVAVQIGQS